MVEESVRGILQSLPPHVILVAAAKTRTPEEALAAISAGVKVIGHNYVQEAEDMFAVIGRQAQWHMIGHLQRNKVKKAVPIFDMIETVDSLPLAEIIDRECEKHKKTMPVLIEINSGREANKTGVLPEDALELAEKISQLPHLIIQGLMTMGPFTGDPEDARPYFRVTREIFEKIKKENLPKAEMKFLSMGMSNSYEVAIEEGANIVRIGTKLFGPRA
ncbi:MAG: YggS family pyridoxal phosphate-dependent enzyme [Calditrichaeota bacterium]|nr:YggS family pyridoxal phosphate-dependent enzyme [Calditrichota bacterium]